MEGDGTFAGRKLRFKSVKNDHINRVWVCTKKRGSVYKEGGTEGAETKSSRRNRLIKVKDGIDCVEGDRFLRDRREEDEVVAKMTMASKQTKRNGKQACLNKSPTQSHY
ncbi:hypothetical protein F2Q70_00015939 [Brassica cretica]|uniref:Uncharacterized protein n=1 Tax=Brassica cretica TaxID=69181 RepID=A0A8S9I3U7_BRACR|nr:hypothetical protein F2Q70_00015939 [Brassica cretica]